MGYTSEDVTNNGKDGEGYRRRIAKAC